MRLTFHGAAGGEVTGSCHLVEAAGQRILLDCGLIQGDRSAEARNREPFEFDPAGIDALVLSHAHIDHLGRVPLLVKRGFRGPIYAQAATCDLAPIMLLDSASLAEASAERASREQEADVEPLYAREDVIAAQKQLRALPYETATQILPGVEVRLHDAGHILGSSMIELREAATSRTLLFTGDVGMLGTPILRDPSPAPRSDLVLMESTYGDRDHKERSATIDELGEIFARAQAQGGNVVIPAFAVGRSQELLYWFAANYEKWNLSHWQVFLDSPMAAKVMAVYDRHEELFDQDARKVWRQRIRPFKLPNLHISETVDDSKAINRVAGGAIIIAGSGMANGGRVRHHLAHTLARASTHVIFVGYQAQGTLGRLLVNRVPRVRLFGEDITVRANIHTVGGLSAHADRQGLLDWYASAPAHPPIALVHGENPAREALAAELQRRYGTQVTLSQPGLSLVV